MALKPILTEDVKLELVNFDPFENLEEVDYDPFAEADSPGNTNPPGRHGKHRRKGARDADHDEITWEKTKQFGRRIPQSIGQGVADIAKSAKVKVTVRDPRGDLEKLRATGKSKYALLNNDLDRKAFGRWVLDFKESNGRKPTHEEMDEKKIEIAEKRKQGAIRKAQGLIDAMPEVEEKAFEGGVMGVVEDATTGLARSLPIMGATALNPMIGFPVAVTQLHGQKADEYIEEGIDPKVADKAARLYAAPAALLETAGSIFGIKAFKTVFSSAGSKLGLSAAVKKKLGAVIQNMVAEGLEEFSQEQWEVVANEYAKDPNASPEEIFQRSKEIWSSPEQWKKAGYATLVGSVGGVIPGAAGGVVNIAISTPKSAAEKISIWAKEGKLSDEQKAQWEEIKGLPKELASTKEKIKWLKDQVEGTIGREHVSDHESSRLESKKDSPKEDFSAFGETEQTSESGVTVTSGKGLMAAMSDKDIAESKQKETQKIRREKRAEKIKEETRNAELATLKIQNEIYAEQQEKAKQEKEWKESQIAEIERQRFMGEIAQPAGLQSHGSTLLKPIEENGTSTQKALVKPMREAQKVMYHTLRDPESASKQKLIEIERQLKEQLHTQDLGNAGYKIQALHSGMLNWVQGKIQDVQFAEHQQAEAEARAKEEAEAAQFKEKVDKQAETNKRAQLQSMMRARLADYREQKKAKAKEAAAKLHKGMVGQTTYKKKTVKTKDGKEIRFQMDRLKTARQYARDKQFPARKPGTKESVAADRKKVDEIANRFKKPAKPKIKAAIRIPSTGEVLTGNSHFEIMGNLNDAQLEEMGKIGFKADRGFQEADGTFLTPEQSSKKYGVTKSQDLRFQLSKEYIKDAAYRTPDGHVYTGAAHPLIDADFKLQGKKKESGFVTSTGRFIDRTEAAEIGGIERDIAISEDFPSLVKRMNKRAREIPEEFKPMFEMAKGRNPILNKVLKDIAKPEMDRVGKVLGIKIELIEETQELPLAYQQSVAGKHWKAFIVGDTAYISIKNQNSVLGMKSSLWHEGGHFSLADLANKGKLGKRLDTILSRVALKYKDEVNQYRDQFEVNRKTAAEEILIDKFTKGRDVALTKRVTDLGKTVWAKVMGGDVITDTEIANLIKKLQGNALARNRAEEGFIAPKEGFINREIAANKYGISKSQQIKFSKSVSKLPGGPTREEMEVITALHQVQDLAKSPLDVEITRKQSDLRKRGVKFSKDDNIRALMVKSKEGKAKKIYFVLENLKSPADAIRAWMHEQVGHYGLIETLNQNGIETQPFMNAVHKLVRNSEAYKQIREAYAEEVKDKSKEERRAYLVEEVLAIRAESLSPTKRKMIYQRFRDIINQWLKSVFGKDTKIQLSIKDVDALLETAKNRIMFGEERAWLEFKYPTEVYKGWLKEVRAKYPKAYSWYANHQALVRGVFGDDSDIFNALLALTSAAARVDTNSAWAVETYLFLNGKRSKPAGRFPNELKRKLDRLTGGEFINEAMKSPQVKVPEFIRALLGDSKATVNDRWMYRAFFGESKLTPQLIEKHGDDLPSLDSKFTLAENTAARHKLFELAEELTKETGERWTPRDIQAGIWMYIASKDKGIDPSTEWDYEKGLTTPQKNKFKGLTPIEYLRKEMGDTPIGELHKKIKTGKPERVSQLEKMYVQYLKKQGVKQIERYSTVPESIGMGVHFGYAELKPGDYIIASDRDGKIHYNSFSRNDIGNRMHSHTEKNPYAPLVYFYETGTKPEPMLRGKPYVYNLDTSKYKIYDSIADALGLRWEAQKQAKRDIAANQTNILANLIKAEGYDGFITNSPFGTGRWILMHEKVAVEHVPTLVDIGISDVVESVESLPQSAKELQKTLGARATRFIQRIKGIRESYPEVRIVRFDPTIARFGEATSDVLEIGATLRLEGPLPAIRAMVSEIALEHSQRQAYIMHTLAKPNGTMVKFKVKPELKTVEDVQKVFSDHGITDLNVVVQPDTGLMFVEQYLWDEKQVDNFMEVAKIVQHPGYPSNEYYPVHSEIHGDDNLNIAPEKFKENLTKYFGEKHGEKTYQEAVQRREAYLNRLRGKKAERGRDTGTEKRVAQRQSAGDLQGVTPDVRFSKASKKFANAHVDSKSYQKYIGPKAKKQKRNLMNLSVWDKMATGIFDSLKPLALLEKGADLALGMSGYKSMNMLSNFPSIFSMFLKHGQVQYKDHWISMDQNSTGIEGITRALGEDADDFFLWMTALSAQELINDGRTNLFGVDDRGNPLNDQDMVDQILADIKPKAEWQKHRDALRDINRSVLDFCEEAGMINKEARKEWERFDYIPFYRVTEDAFEGDIDMMVPQQKLDANIIRALKGGKRNIGDPLVNLINGYSFMLNASLKNVARKKSLLLAMDTELITRLPGKPKGMKLGDGTVAIRHEGDAQYYSVNDRALYDALTDLDQMYQGWLSKVMRWAGLPKHWLTQGVTVAPAFRLANFFRDTIHTSFMQPGFIPLWDSVRGGYHALRNTKEFQEYASTGGAFSGTYASRDLYASSEKHIKKLKDKLTGQRKLHKTRKYTSDLWEKLGEASENAARMGAYLKQRKKGKGAFEAGYEAKDLLDFHKHGKWAAARVMIQLIPFLNARLQGLSKIKRTALKKGHMGRFMMAGALYYFASLMLHMHNEDDERYQKLPDYQKRMYHHIWIGDHHFKLPTPFEVGAIFGTTIPVAMTEWYKGDRTTREVFDYKKPFFGEGWAQEVVKDTFAFNPIPQFAKPFVEWWSNKDSFTGQTVVPSHMQKLPPRLQYDTKTSKMAIEAGNLFNLSPKKIDKFMKDALAFHQLWVTTAGDMGLKYVRDYPNDPAEVNFNKWMQVFGPGRFYESGMPKKYTRQAERYYKMMAEADTAWAEFRLYARSGQKDKARAFGKDNRKLIGLSKVGRQFQQKLTKINQKIKLIEISRKKTAKQKRAEIDQLIELRQKLLIKFLGRVK
jgi:hypothetical protein